MTGVMGDCPSGWGRLLPGATYCWQLMFHSSGYTWEEAEHTCRHSVMPEGTPHLCAISSEAEYVAIKNWLSSYCKLSDSLYDEHTMLQIRL